MRASYLGGMVPGYNFKLIVLSCGLFWILQGTLLAGSQGPVYNGDTLTQQQFIKGCASYRHHFIDNIINGLIEFNLLCDSLKLVSPHPEGHDLFRERLLKRLLECEYRDMDHVIDAAMPTSIWDKQIRNLYKDWGEQYYIPIFQFSFLISNGIIEPKEPYKLTNLKNFWNEVSLYKLEDGQIFVDAGAGIGAVSFILALSQLPFDIYMTELDENYLSYLHRQTYDQSFFANQLQIQVDTAHLTSLGLQPDVMADRILMRDVFHHIKYPVEILQSVRNHLKPDGLLILVESTRELNPKGTEGRCRDAMEIGQILKILADSGFELDKKEIVGTSYVIRYKTRG